MDTSALKNFAQESRRYLMDVVSKKIQYYLTTDNVEIRAKKHLIEELKKEIANSSKDQVIEKIAYTWFNRFCALRYMDVKQYSLVGVLTPMNESHTQPEILMEAKSGHIKDELGNSTSRDHVIGLLSGKVSSNDPQSEAYKLLVLMACNYYHSIMPFLFEKIDDYTELLMPDDLLSEASIISKAREALNEENCKDVEVIGWLYQFYISEKKDEVFEGLKKNKKITPENIPAATQLFTPNWIVRYLVENSLGRLWMLNRPKSNLISKMEYYIKPETEEKDFLKIKGPEEIKVCDPACGSGHMLVYAFDLLYSMYEEEGVDSNEIPSLILKNNLFGIEIDKRSGELAAFALTMKAREKQRRYFKKPVNPNICVLENIHCEESEIKDYMDHVGHDLFSSQLRNTLTQFEEAKSFGSLIRPEVSDVDNVFNLLDQKNVSGHLFLTQTHSKVLKVLDQVKYLSPIYHVVIANPPYIGSGNMTPAMKAWAKEKYPISWDKGISDAFSMFIERGFSLTREQGVLGFMSPFVWMFISSYETLRSFLINNKSISSLVQLEYSGFDGATVPICIFTLINKKNDNNNLGTYIRLSDFKGPKLQAPKTLEAIKSQNCTWRFSVSSESFKSIPSHPISYWMHPKILKLFSESKSIDEISPPRIGMMTTNNERFLRYWSEVDIRKIGFSLGDKSEVINSGYKWFPYNKGGRFRKWAGNNELVVNWQNEGEEISQAGMTSFRGKDFYFKEGITWGDVTSSEFSCRLTPKGRIFDIKGTSCFPSKDDLPYVLAVLNSSTSAYILNCLNPTISFQSGDIRRIPVPLAELKKNKQVAKVVNELVDISHNDWNSRETSYDYKNNVLVQLAQKNTTLRTILENYSVKSSANVEFVIEKETMINELVSGAFGVNDVVKNQVEKKGISLFSNPAYVYGEKQENQKLFETGLILDLISYSVGCMFGRYSLDKEGLILANQGETFKDYLKQIPKSTFVPDEDNIIPILDGDWFIDEISEKFKQFLKITFGDENFVENLKFIEEAIGKDIRKYFVKDFYNDHVKMYKKRPIYWMFSSPKGTFNALIYMHRYTPDTVSIVLNSYLREFRTKLNSKRENLERLSVAEATSSREKTAALKEIEQLKKMIVELDEYEKDILYPLATQRLEIDLDDGVKANYPKFGKALKTIKGLDKKEE